MRRHSNSWFRHITAGVCALLLLQTALRLSAQSGQPVQMLSANQLNDLVGPIALYPDALISQVLVASTNPLELVQAEQWLQRQPGLNGSELTQAAQQQNWDPSVQALLMFPDVLERLNGDIQWTTSLGHAFLAQQPDVMNAIQRMRLSAQQSGKLVSTSLQQVLTTTEAGETFVTIAPVNPDVIYVPVYDPEWFWGPAVYYTYPHWYFRPRPGLSFGLGIPIRSFFGTGWGGWTNWGWYPHWGSRTIVVNNRFIDRYHFNSPRLAVRHVGPSPVRSLPPRGLVVPHAGHPFVHASPVRPAVRGRGPAR